MWLAVFFLSGLLSAAEPTVYVKVEVQSDSRESEMQGAINRYLRLIPNTAVTETDLADVRLTALAIFQPDGRIAVSVVLSAPARNRFRVRQLIPKYTGGEKTILEAFDRALADEDLYITSFLLTHGGGDVESLSRRIVDSVDSRIGQIRARKARSN